MKIGSVSPLSDQVVVLVDMALLWTHSRNATAADLSNHFTFTLLEIDE